MALNLELERMPGSISLTNLQEPSVIKGLMEEGRTPFIIARDWEGAMKSAVCFIPRSDTHPAETFEISTEDAGRIALIRNELQRSS